ncbi:2-aminoethylphosphonate--pyruvate transaminase [Stappia sp. TSB10P1A]|uniref:2-aminoethylphosphonate--pyruvate transaminase n=1 Tax=Stappia sp. TSB10P1A TaxID=2003585 RepID=UPI001643D13F|nr:2-aminoethylphosphonate--pyruvate transaminase [Stappia sp. TSB10P1A]
MSASAGPVLLTPGPLTTSERVKAAMLRDWGSRDPAFTRLAGEVLAQIRDLAGGRPGDHVCVPVQGSGTFAVEAMLGSLLRPDERLLLLVNGAYGRRMAEICRRLGRPCDVVEVAETQAHDPAALAERLAADPGIAAVAIVHCETTSGLLNPLEEIAAVARAAGRRLLVDAMSSFGALAVDMQAWGISALAASSNKCLQGVPGLAFVVCRPDELAARAGVSTSLALDLEDQARALAGDGQWRFTPPTHVVAALHEALQELAEEGGPAARLARYTANRDTLIAGMARLGFVPALDPALQAPVIVSFLEPREAWYDFSTFYDALEARGFAIYAGKMKALGTFRVGTIGAIDSSLIERFLAAVEGVVTDLKQKLIR